MSKGCLEEFLFCTAGLKDVMKTACECDFQPKSQLDEAGCFAPLVEDEHRDHSMMR
jgi:hypothetical protein